MNESKNSFSSKVGFVLAAAGSAVGLGNIWRFPYLASEYGGGIFLLVYLILAVTFGFSLMITEIAIGRKTGKSVLTAYKSVNKKFSVLGILAAVIPAIIFPYYCVIGGWVLKYLVLFISGNGANAAGDGSYFNSFIGSAGEPALFLAIYMFLTAIIVMFGVQKGIERVSKVMMPVLVVIIVGICIYVLTLDGASEGLVYYLKPNFKNFSIKTIVAAMGQLFYSMSLAMGIMVTYGSYMRKEDNLESSVRHIEIFDTAIAFLSGLMIIPAVFAFPLGENAKLQTTGLMFTTMPNVFNSMAGGQIVGTVFFVLVALAALTSSISLMETIVSLLCEKTKLKRVPVCFIVLGISFVIGMVSVLGYSDWAHIKILGRQFLDLFDFMSNNILMPILAFLTCILVGYVVGTKYVEDEVTLNSQFKSKKLYKIMIKYISPIFMIIIFISSVIGYV